jgi:SAM-dependent methyltransferase
MIPLNDDEMRATSPCPRTGLRDLCVADLYSTFLDRNFEIPAISSFLRRKQIEGIIPPEGEALDVGTGIGRLLLTLRELGFKTTGLEPDPCYFERAGKRTQNLSIPLVYSSLDAFSTDKEFDFCILANGVINYLWDKNHRLRSLRKLFTLLSKHGVALLELPDYLEILRRYGQSHDFVTTGFIGAWGVTRTQEHILRSHEALWIHRDRYSFQREDQRFTYEEEFIFRILCLPELVSELEFVGFKVNGLWSSWDEENPKAQKRLIVVVGRGGESSHHT